MSRLGSLGALAHAARCAGGRGPTMAGRSPLVRRPGPEFPQLTTESKSAVPTMSVFPTRGKRPTSGWSVPPPTSIWLRWLGFGLISVVGGLQRLGRRHFDKGRNSCPPTSPRRPTRSYGRPRGRVGPAMRASIISRPDFVNTLEVHRRQLHARVLEATRRSARAPAVPAGSPSRLRCH